MLEDKKTTGRPPEHNLILEDKCKLSITGVTDVDTFDESKVVLMTQEDTLEIEGYDLHINKLNVDNGEVIIEGEIVSIIYTGKDYKNKKGLWSKMFK